MLVLAVVVDVAASAGRIHPGVTVGGVKVGGMNPDRAAAALELQLPEKSKAPVVVRYQGQAWTVAPEDLGLTFDYDALAQQAMGVGRGAGLLGGVRQRAGAWFGAAELPARASAEPVKLAAILNEVSAGTDVPPRDAKVKFKGTTPRMTSAESGMAVNREQLTTSILTAFTSSDREIEAPVAVAQADVSDEAAQAAMVAAEKMIAAPATVTWGSKKSWKLTPDDLADMIVFRKIETSSGAGWILEPYVSQKEASKTVAPMLGGKIGHPARDARFRTRSGTVSIVPSKTGVGPDIEALAEGPDGGPQGARRSAPRCRTPDAQDPAQADHGDGA